jgi:hypothetical protein
MQFLEREEIARRNWYEKLGIDGAGPLYPHQLFAGIRVKDGDEWGDFIFDRKNLCLTHQNFDYELDLEKFGSSSALLDMMFQISRKTWMTRGNRGYLLEALQELLDPQQNLCSFGGDKHFEGIAEYLRARTDSASAPTRLRGESVKAVA